MSANPKRRPKLRTKRTPAAEITAAGATAVAKAEPADVALEEAREEERPEWLPGLLPSEEKFALLYLQFNCSGPDAVLAMRPEISRNAARCAAHRLMKRPEIQARIFELHEEMQAELKFTAKRVFLEIARIARGDVRKLYDENGNLRPVHELGDDEAALIAGIEVYEDFLGTEAGEKVQVGQTKKIRLRDRLAALKALGEYHGMFAKDGGGKLPTMIVSIKI